MLEVSAAPCMGELFPNSAVCIGCGAAIALEGCTVCSVANFEGCVAMIPLGCCLFCFVGSTNCCVCEVSKDVFARQICFAIMLCNSSDSRIPP